MSRKPAFNPEKKEWRGVSHKNGKRVRDLKEQDHKDHLKDSEEKDNVVLPVKEETPTN